VVSNFLPSLSAAASVSGESAQVMARRQLLLHPVVQRSAQYSSSITAMEAVCMPVVPSYGMDSRTGGPWAKRSEYAVLPLGMNMQGKRVLISMHRLVLWALSEGPAAGVQTKCLHRCVGSKHCVNPIHLYWGSAAENAADREAVAQAGAPTVDWVVSRMSQLSVLNMCRKLEAAERAAAAQEQLPQPGLPLPQAAPGTPTRFGKTWVIHGVSSPPDPGHHSTRTRK